MSLQDVFQRMQHNTLKIEDCTGGKCTTEIVRVHDTAVLDSARQLGQQPEDLKQAGNASSLQHNTISIEKQPGKPLVVTVKQNGTDLGQQVTSGGTVLTDDAQDNLVQNQTAVQQRLAQADPEVARRASEVADELSNHRAAKHPEGDNALEMHRANVSNVAVT